VTNYSNLFKQFLQEKQYIGGVTAGGSTLSRARSIRFSVGYTAKDTSAKRSNEGKAA